MDIYRSISNMANDWKHLVQDLSLYAELTIHGKPPMVAFGI